MNKKGEFIGALIGSLVGCVLTGVAIHYTNSPYCIVIAFACMMFGSWLGNSISKNK